MAELIENTKTFVSYCAAGIAVYCMEKYGVTDFFVQNAKHYTGLLIGDYINPNHIAFTTRLFADIGAAVSALYITYSILDAGKKTTKLENIVY